MSSDSEDSNASDDVDYVPPGAEDSEDDLENTEVKEDNKEDEKVSQDQKKKLDEVWDNFKKETEPSGTSRDKNTKEKHTSRPNETVTVTKVYDFAGEEVKVTKQVAANSVEAYGQNVGVSMLKKGSNADTTPLGRLKRSSGGIHSVLGKLGKKPKLSTLEKSKLDWVNFKEEKGIHEELNSYKKGKDGYLEKQSFLERTDLRQFEKERDLRLGRTSSRR